MGEDYLILYFNLSRADCFQNDNMTPIGILEYYYKQLLIECKKRNITTVEEKTKKLYETNNYQVEDVTDVSAFPKFISEKGLELNHLQDFVFDMPQTIYEENNDKYKGVFVFIDDIQLLKGLGGYRISFLWILRSYVQNHKNVAYVLSGSMSIKDKLIYEIAGEVFGGRLLSIHIPYFSKEITKKYLEEKAEELQFTEEGFEKFYEYTSGIPAYINTFGTLLPENTKLTEEVITQEFNENIAVISDHLIKLWIRLTRKEKNIIISLINQPQKRIEIAKQLNVTTGSLSKSLNKLQDLSLIEYENNAYVLSEMLLGKWLKREYEEKGCYPYIIL